MSADLCSISICLVPPLWFSPWPESVPRFVPLITGEHALSALRLILRWIKDRPRSCWQTDLQRKDSSADAVQMKTECLEPNPFRTKTFFTSFPRRFLFLNECCCLHLTHDDPVNNFCYNSRLLAVKWTELQLYFQLHLAPFGKQFSIISMYMNESADIGAKPNCFLPNNLSRWLQKTPQCYWVYNELRLLSFHDSNQIFSHLKINWNLLALEFNPTLGLGLKKSL